MAMAAYVEVLEAQHKLILTQQQRITELEGLTATATEIHKLHRENAALQSQLHKEKEELETVKRELDRAKTALNEARRTISESEPVLPGPSKKRRLENVDKDPATPPQPNGSNHSPLRRNMERPGTSRLLPARTSQPYRDESDSDCDPGDSDDSDDSADSSSTSEPPPKPPKKNGPKNGPSAVAHIPDGCKKVGASFSRKSIGSVFGGNLRRAIVCLSQDNDLGIKQMAFYRFDTNIKAPLQPLADGALFIGLTHEDTIGTFPRPADNLYELFIKYTKEQRKNYGEDCSQGERWRYVGTYEFQRIERVPIEEWAEFDNDFKNVYAKMHEKRLRPDAKISAAQLLAQYNRGKLRLPQVKTICRGYNKSLQAAICDGRDRRV